MCRLFLLAASASLLAGAETDPLEIIRRSVSRDQTNWERLKDFTFEEREETRRKDGEGNVKDRESKTYDVLILEGTPYKRLIRRDDQPLSAKEEEKESRKFDKELAERRNEGEAARQKRIRKFEKERTESREFAREIPQAFDFRLAGEETVDGRPVWVIEAEPKPGYQARAKRAGVLKRLRGRLWIDQHDFEWVKAEADVIETLSFGLFLVRVQKGARMTFTQRQERAMWVPSFIQIAGSAKLGLVKNFHLEHDIRFRHYRRFSTDVRLIPAESGEDSLGETETGDQEPGTAARDRPSPQLHLPVPE